MDGLAQKNLVLPVTCTLLSLTPGKLSLILSLVGRQAAHFRALPRDPHYIAPHQARSEPLPCLFSTGSDSRCREPLASVGADVQRCKPCHHMLIPHANSRNITPKARTAPSAAPCLSTHVSAISIHSFQMRFDFRAVLLAGYLQQSLQDAVSGDR